MKVSNFNNEAPFTRRQSQVFCYIFLFFINGMSIDGHLHIRWFPLIIRDLIVCCFSHQSKKKYSIQIRWEIMVISISNNLYIHACDNIFIIFQNYIECLFKFNRKISYSYIMYFHLIINIIIKIYFFLLCFYKEICDAKIFYYIHAYTQNVCAYVCVCVYTCCIYINFMYINPKSV